MFNEHSMTLNIASNKSEYEVDIPFDKLRFKPNINNNQNVSNNFFNGQKYFEFHSPTQSKHKFKTEKVVKIFNLIFV